jgi:hypothetical protein
MRHASPTAVTREVEPARDTVDTNARNQNANLNASCPCRGICADDG